jgi:branched-chain amino acid transport system ATP-binding protein
MGTDSLQKEKTFEDQTDHMAESENPSDEKSLDSPALALDNIVKDFGGLRAVDGVSLDIARGERRAIIGPNGAGKTTMFNLITGELSTTSGRVFLSGQEITKMSPNRRIGAGLGRTYQITNVFSGLTVEKNVQLAAQGLSNVKFNPLRSYPKNGPMQDKVEQALEDLNLERVRNAIAGELSYGEQRQLEIALALVGDPKVLLLDEPAAGLASEGRAAIGELIKRLPSELTIILIEHDMDLALGLADRVTCLHYGQVIAQDTPEGIRQNKQIQEIYLGTS